MKPSLRFLVFLLGASLPGFLLGWWIVSASSGGASAKLPIVQNSRPREELDRLRRENLMAAVETVRTPGVVDAGTDHMQRFLDEVDASGMRIVPVDSLRDLDVKAIEGGMVADDIRDVLFLSPEEVERVNRVIREAGERLNQAELERLEIVEVSDTKTVFHIPALGEVGQQVKREFQEELKKALGDMDGNAFLMVMGDHHITASDWDGFGRYDRTVTFSVEPRDDGRVWLQFEQESPVDQVEAYHHARGEGVSGNIGIGRGFGTNYPYGPRQAPPHRSLQRSQFLLPLLPEELRFYFEEVEQGR